LKVSSGNLAGQHRIRTGDYRVQFKVEGKGTSAVVTVNKVGHRDGFYE
jgi:mRNA-degrading endonuclease RelE of RelBE toxin-antitoxin system